MCNVTDLIEDFVSTRNLKRKRSQCSSEDMYIPSKRISPFSNTPKEKRDMRKKIFKMSVQKLKGIENGELFMRKSVLINNIMKRMQAELIEDKSQNTDHPCRAKHGLVGFEILNNNCLSESFLHDDPFLSGIHDKITDDMTDTLVINLENRLGINIASLAGQTDMCSTNKTDSTYRGKDAYSAQSEAQPYFCHPIKSTPKGFCDCFSATNTIRDSFHASFSVNQINSINLCTMNLDEKATSLLGVPQTHTYQNILMT